MANNKYLGKEFSEKKQEFVNAKFSKSDVKVDLNFNSLFGTIFSVSTAATAGHSETAITPGFRFLKMAIGITQVYKKMTANLFTIKSKITKITAIMNSFSTGKYNHVRKSVIKRKVNIKKM